MEVVLTRYRRSMEQVKDTMQMFIETHADDKIAAIPVTFLNDWKRKIDYVIEDYQLRENGV